MWHLPQFSKRLELLIKPSNFGYNAYNQTVVVKIPNQVISYLTSDCYISFVDIEGNTLCFSSKKFSPGTNEVEYYIKLESIDDINYTSLFIYYEGVGVDYIYGNNVVTNVNLNTGWSKDYTKNIHWNDISPPPGISSQVVSFENDEYDGTGYWYSYSDYSPQEDNTMYIISIWAKTDQVSNVNIRAYTADNYESDRHWTDFLTINSSEGWKRLEYNVFTTANPTDSDSLSFKYTNLYEGGYTRLWLCFPQMVKVEVANSLFLVFDDAYIINHLSETTLFSEIGPNFSNHNASLHQPICDTYAVKIVGDSTYVLCSISKSSFTLFFNCCLLSGEGYLVYFSMDNYVYVNIDGSLVAKISGTEYTVGSKLYFNTCSTFSITCDSINTHVIINGLTKLVIKQTFSISEICLGGNGSSGYSIECYFWDLFLLPYKLPLYSYYLHNTTYDNSNFFRESGYDNIITNGYLTHWPEVIFSGDEAIFRANSCSGVVYSTSFDNGSSWYISGLNYDDIFTKYFGSSCSYDTVLRLTSSSGTIDKNYIIKVNDFNKFDINYAVDFLIGSEKNGYSNVVTDFTIALHDKNGINIIPAEYGYEGGMDDLKSFYLERPVTFSWGGVLGSGIISKTVEFCFDTIMDSWFDDTYVDFWLGELGQGYYINIPTYFTINSGINTVIDLGIDFVLANWKYFPYKTSMICSVLETLDESTEIEVGKGGLMRFLSDVKASDMVYNDFTSSVFCSLSGIFPDYFFDVQTTSGTLSSYDSNIYCSLLDIGDYCTEVKLNTIVIENFNIDIGEIATGIPNFCFSVDVYDKHYGVTESGINVYMNTNIVIENIITDLQFSSISGGYSISWCYDISSLGSLEYVEIIVYAINTCGDINLSSYFLKYGKRYYYNLYHIIKHEYETLIPMLMVAENNVDIFPSFSTESMYVRIENYKRKNLSASIFGVGLDRRELPADIKAVTTNFYNGGDYKVRIECKDLSGNTMNPFEFEFTIRSDGL